MIKKIIEIYYTFEDSIFWALAMMLIVAGVVALMFGIIDHQAVIEGLK